jgi:ATP-binding cassette subfamily B protein
MLRLEWRLTLLAIVVLPLFLIPARLLGRKLRAAVRRQMTNYAEMNTIDAEKGLKHVAIQTAVTRRAGDMGAEPGAVRAERGLSGGVRELIVHRGKLRRRGLVRKALSQPYR